MPVTVGSPRLLVMLAAEWTEALESGHSHMAHKESKDGIAEAASKQLESHSYKVSPARLKTTHFVLLLFN